ncbi:NACHT, LRR and PYD domains-containing protein 3-like [Mugil cephalus]|uniref:NACHT, LRR and PYD domains-containing protein 3-like n=1 Tax=Mugil cephalus TaxID=48193 RepID=UPI001FB5FC33|nr:NACHT, LRR and PYD domains-containing protein 3-like [Mugil cephalus]
MEGVSANNGSIVNQPHLSSVNVQGNLTLNTYGLSENIRRCQDDLKSFLKDETEKIREGLKEDASWSLLDKIYTELYITEGENGAINGEHEITELECSRNTSEERKIDLNHLFQPLSGEDIPRKVLTRGIAGIGKTVAVQKFTYDWATGRANQGIQFIFPFSFRELNLIKDERLSLKDLICQHFEEVNDLEISDYKSCSVLFIFDGLDESKLALDFSKNQMCRSVTALTTVDVLLTNLLKGKLLRNASIWITSRPAAASKIPPEFIDRVTEVRGFTDEQKYEYFQKKISDNVIAQKIYDHLQSKPLRSLYIMCHIPMFCWISATVLQSLLTDQQQTELPKTVTEMYTHFLIVQTKSKQKKDYQEGETDQHLIMKLGKLAFEQLQKGNMIFKEEDLKDCEIDLNQAAVYSGICTQIIRKECGLYKQEFYAFIHLSVQEFLAALYVLQTFIEKKKNLLYHGVMVMSEEGEILIIFLHKSAVDKALKSDSGEWDLFLRFLLGLSQETNQRLLQSRLGLKEGSPQSYQDTIDYIHEKIKKLSYTDKSINLFHCLNELGDRSLVEQVQSYQSSGDVSKISPAHWSALAFVLLVSKDDLSVFELKKYYGSDEVLERLVPVLKVSKTALLSDCNLTVRCCRVITSVLSFKSSGLEELDLSGNQLQDIGIEPLASGLKSPHCKLQRLSLRRCGITETGCKPLTLALTENPSHLRELDLSKNKFQDELMLFPVIAEKCCLETLRLSDCGITEYGCNLLVSAFCLNPSHLKNLDLSRNSLGDKGVARLSDLLRSPDCQLQRLWLFKTDLQSKDAEVLVSALVSNPSHLKELDLGANDLGDAGVKEVAALLKHQSSMIDTLRLSGCRFTKTGCIELASSLKSNPSYLRVLDVSRNHLLDLGVENLSEFLAEPLCKLETLNLKCCTLTDSCCRLLTFALSCSSALKDLDLSFNQLKDQGMKLLCDWLRKPKCQLEILRLSWCTDRSCQSLASALSLNPSHLRELHLSKTSPGGSGLELLSDLKELKLMVTE